MKKKEATDLGIAIAGLILEHGVPAALEIMGTLQKVDVTAADIRALRDKVPSPESYRPR